MMRYSRYLIGLFVLALLALGAYFLLWRPTVYTTNIVVDGDLSIGRRAMVMKSGATLTVKGNLTVDGQLRCKDGSLNITVEGKLTLNKTIACQIPALADSESTAPAGVTLVLGSSAEFQAGSLLASNGHIQIVEATADLQSEEELNQTFEEVVTDTGSEPRIGPLGNTSRDTASTSQIKSRPKPTTLNNNLPTVHLTGKSSLFDRAYAQTPPRRIILGGTMYIGSWGKKLPKTIDVKKLPKNVKRVVVRAYFPNGDVEFADKSVIYAPDGQDGPDITGGCDINIPKSESLADKKARDAMRMRVQARTITVGELDLYLGDGGRGGNATTDKDCDPIGKAIAGHGGQSGNFKMSTAPEGNLTIKGPFRIHPGVSGAGGTATAYGNNGKSGEIGENGKGAAAVGGNGADNIKVLRAKGVAGLSNIYVDSLIAGNGGNAIANPGNGGDSSKCDIPGGLAGAGGASAGAGGIAKLEYPPEVKDLPDAADLDGVDGKPTVNDANSGKDGPPCPIPSTDSTDNSTKSPDTVTPAPSSNTPSTKQNDNKQLAPPSSSTPTEPLPLGYFEFLDQQYERTATLPSGAKAHIIVASTLGNPDMRTKMPIQLEFIVDGQVIWTGTIQGDPNLTCRGADGCSMDGPVIDPSWVKKKLKATGKNGEILATYSEN